MSEIVRRVAQAMRGWRGDPHLSPELTSFELGLAEVAVKAMSEWLPIKSAPRDGTELILWCPAPGSEYQIMGFWKSEFLEWVESYTGLDIYQPTHWMPLPAPPEAK